ncbi:D-amino-acid transaminase [Paraglaciecola sp. L1A13]|uniref:D-amino-acid transaminase n=1 Tax=Paraglaciecola sp. L1A13 TaxID=2686359 RepID=UPI00131BE50F|nr:D-amino-acid transaminase [Paraglaciecola sp. L1A13]
MNTVYLNGDFLLANQAKISPLDRGFLFADGIYEVIPAVGGILFGLDEHLKRLERSLAALSIENPMSKEAWVSLCHDMVARNGEGDLSIYIQVTRGAPYKRDHKFPAPADEVKPTVFLTASSLERSSIYNIDATKGASAIVRDDIRWSRCDIKSVSLLPNVMIKQEANESGAMEAILKRDGFITEGTSSNVFIVKNGIVVTPPLSNRILPGVTRIFVLKMCEELGYKLEERDFTEDELRAADELWISSSTKDVLPIVSLEEDAIGDGKPGPMWKDLAERLMAFKHPD